MIVILENVTKNQTIRLTALDQSPVRLGSNVSEALKESIKLAQACEKAGYHRYWLAGHHATTSYAGSAPKILVIRIAATSNKIQVEFGADQLVILTICHDPATRVRSYQL